MSRNQTKLNDPDRTDPSDDADESAREYPITCVLEDTRFVVTAAERPNYCPGCGRGLR